MHLLCLGLSRTGTQSLREALFQIGYDDVYHQTNFNQNDPYDAELWLDAYRNRFESQGTPWDTQKWKNAFDAALGHCMAVSDVPCITFWRELMEAYPDAKVLITVRDSPEESYRSFMESSMILLGGLFGNGPVSWMSSKFLPVRPSSQYAKLMLKYDDAYGTCFQDYLNGTRNGVLAYDRHNRAVQAFAEEQGRELLIFNVKQGWKPLCDFLREKQPETAFPRLNDKAYFQKGTATLHRLTMLGAVIGGEKLALPVLVVAVALWFGVGYFIQ